MIWCACSFLGRSHVIDDIVRLLIYNTIYCIRMEVLNFFSTYITGIIILAPPHRAVSLPSSAKRQFHGQLYKI